MKITLTEQDVVRLALQSLKNNGFMLEKRKSCLIQVSVRSFSENHSRDWKPGSFYLTIEDEE